MKIILVEFPWQVEQIINNKESFKPDVIISLDAESSYILKSNNIKYFETYQFCNHDELWSKYKEITKQTLKIVNILDKALWETDKRFKDLNWTVFNDYHYSLKISYDQLFYYSELIIKLIEQFKPTEIIIADSTKIIIDDYYFLISSKKSIIKHLLKGFEANSNKIKITLSKPESNKNENSFSFSRFFLKYKNIVKIFIISKIKNIYYKINFFINLHNSKAKYISINCLEIIKFKKLYPNESKFFLDYNYNNLNNKKVKNKIFIHNNFISHLKNKTNFYDLIKNKNIDFSNVFNEIIFKLVNQLDFLFFEYKKAQKIINKIKPKCLIFQSMAPFNSANIIFRKVCIDNNIPFAVWTHGGLGLTYSLSVYDVTDFRFCKNHISYGPYLQDLIKSNNSILKELELNKDQKVFPVGSPKFDFDIEKNKIIQQSTENKKKNILFTVGCGYEKNRFFFGRNRKKFETSLWEFHYEILLLLQKYQNKYNIIIKDYNTDYSKKQLWKRILKNINADKISYVSNEENINSLLNKSDLNISPWLSTFFFEALHFDADIFAVEEDMFEELLRDDLIKEIFYFTNNDAFLKGLEKYLKIGNFYTRKKKNSMNYFLKSDSFNKRDKVLNNSLLEITS